MDSMTTLTEICQYLKNWFGASAVYSGTIKIAEGTIECSRNSFDYEEIQLANNQYFRVQGSVFSDGVHAYPDLDMPDEVFEGTITPMRVPQAILTLAEDITAWRAKYEGVDATAMSPYTSESFAGYSYSKAGAGGNSGDGIGGWQAAFKNRLTHWRKI